MKTTNSPQIQNNINPQPTKANRVALDTIALLGHQGLENALLDGHHHAYQFVQEAIRRSEETNLDAEYQQPQQQTA